MTSHPAHRPAEPADRIQLRRDGVGVVLDLSAAGLPAVLHWGADLGVLGDDDLTALADGVGRQAPPATLDAAWQPSLVPQETDGWPGRPGLLLERAGVPLVLDWTVTGASVDGSGAAGARAGAAPTGTAVEVVAEADGLTLTTRLRLEPGGLLTVGHELTNGGEQDVVVHWLETTLPVPTHADRATTFTGRWAREKVPTSGPLARGSVTRQTRRGRAGHDHPWLLALSAEDPRDRDGELWASHLGWSGDATYRTDRLPEHPTLLGVGELLRPGEVRLATGQTYATPTGYFAWSDAGLDGISARFHTYLRSRPQHPRTERPLVLNTWEAVYFDHQPATVLRLAERAAQIGVERFVLDDGWFPARRDDTRGLGDWTVDRTVWPDGLEPLADRVHELGMQFGLWFEPEMVCLDSDLARAHPDWLLHDPAHVPGPERLSWRTQWVLDLARPEAYAHVRDAIGELVDRLGIDFIKWDHNRDLVDARHDGRPGVHEQTLAAYRMIAELKATHPGLEIESCSSGGARTDLGILQVTDRVWASDSNDAVERQDIQRWTGLLLPPELVGAHVGPEKAHSSGRSVDLSYRLATALMGSAGLEWDVLGCSEQETATLVRFAALYRELRPVLHHGTVVHADVRDPALRVTGVVSSGRDEGVWTIATVASLEDARPERVRLHGLDPDRRYRVRVRDEIGTPQFGWVTPPWVAAGEVVLPGRVLGTVGLQIPMLWVAQALVLHVTEVTG